jgi:hypothetical protein
MASAAVGAMRQCGLEKFQWHLTSGAGARSPATAAFFSMADSAVTKQSRPERAASKKRRQATVPTETEKKLARAARSAQRLAQLSDVARDDSTLDLFPDDPTRATLEAMNIDIRQGTLHGFELPDVVLAAVGALDASAEGASMDGGKAARRTGRGGKSDESEVVSAQLTGLEIEPSAAVASDAARESSAVDSADGDKLATSALTPAMAAATVARSVTALRQAVEPGGVSVDSSAGGGAGQGNAKSGQRLASTERTEAALPGLADATAASPRGGAPVALESGLGLAAGVASSRAADTQARRTAASTSRFASSFADETKPSAIGSARDATATATAGIEAPETKRIGTAAASAHDTTSTATAAKEALDTKRTVTAPNSARDTTPTATVATEAPETKRTATALTSARGATSTATAATEAQRAEPAAAAPTAPTAPTAPELDRARATAFADTVDALYGVIADQRRAATDHSRRMKWMLSIVVGALLMTVAIGITQTLLLMRLTRETTAQQHRVEEMMQNQQAAMASLLDTQLAMANAAAAKAASPAVMPTAGAAAGAAPQQATTTPTANGKRAVRTQHAHKPKTATR